MNARPLGICLAVAVVFNSANAQRQEAPPEPAVVDDYYNIGDIHFEVSTDSAEAQKWFDRGLAMCQGFNHDEGIRCFERAVQADPGLAMAYWGIAYALGPNINYMIVEPHKIAMAHHAAHLAKLHATEATELERDLIDAVAKRYAVPMPEDHTPLNEAYVSAMRELHKKHTQSPLVAALFAESLMNLQPWKHWNPAGEPGPHTAEIVETLESALDRWPHDPALCHLYIHAMEASPTPEKALPAANRLRDAVPGSGHLVHMPTHIDIWTGDYEKVVSANARAIELDKLFLEREGPYNFYSFYRIHNYHFLVYGAMFDGQSVLALKTAREIPKQIPEDMLREQVDFLDAFMPMPLHVLVRFGQWEQILKEPEPAEYLPVSQSLWHYARAIAYAATDRVEQAEEEREQFIEAADKVPDTSFLFQNASQHILEVAEAMIDGEIAYRRGEHEAAFAHLRRAVELDDALNYDEPWGWMQPARHALGALLAEQGRFAESEQVFRKDLRRHPNNPWALHGLAEALREQDKLNEAKKYAAEFQTACSRADVAIDRSCFCRLKAAVGE